MADCCFIFFSKICTLLLKWNLKKMDWNHYLFQAPGYLKGPAFPTVPSRPKTKPLLRPLRHLFQRLAEVTVVSVVGCGGRNIKSRIPFGCAGRGHRGLTGSWRRRHPHGKKMRSMHHTNYHVMCPFILANSLLSRFFLASYDTNEPFLYQTKER